MARWHLYIRTLLHLYFINRILSLMPHYEQNISHEISLTIFYVLPSLVFIISRMHTIETGTESSSWTGVCLCR
jgi:hypothetical protein